MTRGGDGAALWAAMMEFVVGTGVATLASYDDGTTSLYFSTGGAVIGAGFHEPVQEAASRFRALTAASLERFTQVADLRTPLPREGGLLRPAGFAGAPGRR